MNKTLLLVRHADAAEAEVGQKDVDRELSPKGYQDATRLGYYFYEQQQAVDLMLVSTAHRARRTAEILAEQMRCNSHKIQFVEKLYQASVRVVLDLINDQTDSVTRLMIVGHNPTLSYLAEYLTGEAVGSMVPGGVFVLQPAVDEWSAVSQHSVVLQARITPDQLRK